MKNKQLNENIVTQRRKKNKQSQHLENGKVDQSHYKSLNAYATMPRGIIGSRDGSSRTIIVVAKMVERKK